LKTDRFRNSLIRYYSFYTGGFIAFILLLAIAEALGLPKRWVGYCFLFSTFMLYASIGVLTRTRDEAEYYVAGRRVPALFNGMATGADWMSAASFIGMAGTLYLTGYEGLAFVLGWTGGYVLVALLIAPYLRKFGQFTIPDFLGARYGSHVVRSLTVLATVIASFVYVVAQIYGVGLIASRFMGIDFVTGTFVGLAGILLCSFLGGMRAVTWTQVAQYIILIVAYIAPVVMLSYKLTGNAVPQIAYGQVLSKLTLKEKELFASPLEIKVRELFTARAEHLDKLIKGLPASLATEQASQQAQLEMLRGDHFADGELVRKKEAELQQFPANPVAAQEQWTRDLAAAQSRAAPPRPHGQAFAGATQAERDDARTNMLALVFCLMVGTAALPHVLIRSYTTPSVREARRSVFWSLAFISLLYFTAPALAVLIKSVVYNSLIGYNIADLPSWVQAWGRIGLISIDDINRDGVLQLAELTLDPDVIVLATPEIAGLPYVVSGLVAAGGLAAALSTADGLLLTIANALSHDVYFKIFAPKVSANRRILLSKILLLLVAIVAAAVAAQKPAHILNMVSWAFSIAGSAFFPALVCGVFWKRANKWGAMAGMLAGLGVCLGYLYAVKFGGMAPWFGIKDVSAGVFGVAAGFATIVTVSLLTPRPERKLQEMVDYVRYPEMASRRTPATVMESPAASKPSLAGRARSAQVP
jgi:cation/acetate symporter